MNAKILRIGLIGAMGRMGQAIASIPSQTTVIAALFTKENPSHAGAPVDLFLDVSSADALEHNLTIALFLKKPIVVGTTGKIDFESLKAAASSIPVFYAANFSLGMALMKRATEVLAKRFHPAASIEMTETHHPSKKDAPSGSALMLAESVEKYHPSKVAIRSIRIEQAIGKHEIHFSAKTESITLIHESHERTAFAHGAIEAAGFLAVQSPGFYTMDDLINE